MNQPATKHDTSYEWKAVLLLFLGFGLVGLDRWVIAQLWPEMYPDLGLASGDIGYIVGVLGVSWGVFTIVAGNISDHIGRRKVLLPALLIFSLMSGVSGIASTLAAFLIIRAVMGATEGAYLSTSTALTGEASLPTRRGLNQGILLSSFSLFGLAFAPLIATSLSSTFARMGAEEPWRWVFVIVAIPGFVLAYFLYRVIREPAHLKNKAKQADASADPADEKLPWSAVLRNRNILLSMLGILCGMCCIFVTAAFLPTYLQGYLGFDAHTMALLVMALGLGGAAGSIAIPFISDYTGRRFTSAISFGLTFIFLFIFINVTGKPFTDGAPGWVELFWLLFAVSFFGSSIISLLTGPVAVEAVPPRMHASAIGIISGTGEIFGGLATFASGYITNQYGIREVFYFSLIAVGIGAIVMLGLRETAPRRVQAREARKGADSPVRA